MSQSERRSSLAGRMWRGFARWLAYVLAGLFALELFSFAVILASNRIIYGSVREGTPVDYDGYALYLSSDGFRQPVKLGGEAGGKKIRIWFFGGSTLRCEDEPLENTIPGLVCAGLFAARPDAAIECRNYGVNSYNSLLETKLLQKLLAEGERPPDLLVFYDGANDLNYFATFRSVYAHEGFARVKALIESYHNSLFGLFKPLCAAFYASYSLELYSRLHYLFAKPAPDSGLNKEFLAAELSRYDYLERTSQSLGSRFALYLQPFFWVEPEISGNTFESAPLSALKARFPGLAGKLGGLYDSLEAELGGRPYFQSLRNLLGNRDYQAYLPDGVHNTQRARQDIARAIAKDIESRLNQQR